VKTAERPGYALDLEDTVIRAAERLRGVSDAEASRRPSPGKWSAKEIIGHLIDSASNNHQRFVRAQFQDDLIFPGYRQDEWVASQQYQTAPWGELLDLWVSFNRHIARVMGVVPEADRMKEHRRHNLDQLAWVPMPADAPATLDYFMRDYVGHLHHHLKQIEGLHLHGAGRASGGFPSVPS
jgi:hypothetical protein